MTPDCPVVHHTIPSETGTPQEKPISNAALYASTNAAAISALVGCSIPQIVQYAELMTPSLTMLSVMFSE